MMRPFEELFFDVEPGVHQRTAFQNGETAGAYPLFSRQQPQHQGWAKYARDFLPL